MNQYIVIKNQQIAIEAETPEDAATQALAGKGNSPGVSINVQLRPKPAEPTIGVGAPSLGVTKNA